MATSAPILPPQDPAGVTKATAHPEEHRKNPEEMSFEELMTTFVQAMNTLDANLAAQR